MKPSVSLSPVLLEPAFELWKASSVEKVGRIASGKPSPAIEHSSLTIGTVQNGPCITNSLVPVKLSPGFELWRDPASPISISQKPALKFRRSRYRPTEVHLVENSFIPAHAGTVFELWHAPPGTEELLGLSASDTDGFSKHPSEMAGYGVCRTRDPGS